MKLLLNNQEYEIQQGFTITQNYNETLDSANIIITHIQDDIDIEPLDECEIISDKPYEGFVKKDDNTYAMYMCIDSYNRKQLSLGDNPYFKYEITLISRLKELEGIILPSLKITLNKANKQERTLYYYIENYLFTYTTRTRNENGFLIKKFTLDEGTNINKLKSTLCPEMQWNNPNLKQVITDLSMVADLIPTIIDHKINFINIAKNNGEIEDKSCINYVEQSQSSDDYVSALRMNVQNAIQGEDELVEITEHINFRNNDVGIMTDQDIRLETKYPIYELIDIKMECACECNAISTGASKTFYYDVRKSLKQLTYEKGVYDTKPIWFKESIFQKIDPTLDELSKYQNFSLYYSRGDNKILGWNVLTNSSFVWTDKFRTIDYITQVFAQEIYSLAKYEDGKYWISKIEGEKVVFYYLSSTPKVHSTLNELFFTIKYKTSADALFEASKGLDNKQQYNHKIVVDNQSSSYVDTNAQGILEYLKANRLGNKMLLMNARYKNDENNFIGKLGETYNNNVIFKKTIAFFKDYNIVNYYATKDYILRDYFTGVQSRQRSWKLVSGNEALLRKDLFKINVIACNKKYNEFESDEFILPRLTNFEIDKIQLTMNLCNTFKVIQDRQPFYASAIQFHSKNKRIGANMYQEYYPGYFDAQGNYGSDYTKYIGSELITRTIGNSIVFNVSFSDNIYGGKIISGQTEGGYAQSPLRYADENGENFGGTWIIGEKIKDNIQNKWNYIWYPSDDENAMNNNIELKLSSTNEKPLIIEEQITNPVCIDFALNKDNSEIQNLSLQLEFSGDEKNDVYIYKDFIKYTPFVNTQSDYKIVMYESTQKPNTNVLELPSDSVVCDFGEESERVQVLMEDDGTHYLELKGMPTHVETPAGKQTFYEYICADKIINGETTHEILCAFKRQNAYTLKHYEHLYFNCVYDKENFNLI